ncbi:MAG: hypothetical protein FJ403_12880 [Verrucomicrobia bacterium]|nr:hypothetical protein [Verrucomicrobiota bacterium]
MRRVRFLADHDLNEHLVLGAIRCEPSIEFLRVREVGLGSADDCDVLDYAANEGLIVVSHDVNTMPAAAFRRLENGKPMGGLFMVKQSDPIAPIIESLILTWSARTLQEWTNRVIFLPIR